MSDSPPPPPDLPPPPPPDFSPPPPPDLPPPPPPAIEVPPLPPVPSVDIYQSPPPDLNVAQPPPFMPMSASDPGDVSGSQFASDRKSSNILMYVGIGCGLLALLAIVAVVLGIGWGVRKVGGVVSELQANPEKFAAEMLVKSDPELELITSDEVGKAITFRRKTTGETITVSYAEAAKGNLTVTTAGSPDGTYTITTGTWKDAPAWFPAMGGLQPGTAEIRSRAEGGQTIVLTAVTDATTDEVVTFYSDELDKLGFTIARQSKADGGQINESIEATDHAANRRVTFNITRSAPGSKVVVVTTIDSPPAP